MKTEQEIKEEIATLSSALHDEDVYLTLQEFGEVEGRIAGLKWVIGEDVH